MVTRLFQPRLLPYILLLLLAVPAFAASQPGQATVIKTQGTASLVTKGGAKTPVTEGAKLGSGSGIQTGEDGTVVVLFSNGSTFTVEPDTAFRVDEFLQDPFDTAKTDFSKIEREPSTSQTKLQLTEGSIVANVRKLNPGSKMEVGTPIGVAGIRGTIVRITVTDNNGDITVKIDLTNGSVVFEVIDGRTVNVRQDTTVIINLKKDRPEDIGIREIPLGPQDANAINNTANQSLNSIPDGAFSGDGGIPGFFTGDQGVGTVGQGFGGGGGSGGGNPSGQPTPTPAPTAVPTPPAPPS
ncbi:MAG: FecR domain-containing protein [Terrimicrobiaceae bacterium]|nr:FecR domain-containing protein [Terrimicrobiaceae bacterium]